MRRALLLATFASLLAAATPLHAEDPKMQAKALFNAGAQAYGSGQYLAAIDAFDEAYKLTPLPAILFSLGQAERRQYVVDKKPDWVLRAVDHFRKYVDQVATGGRRADAVAALQELEPLADKVKGSAQPAAPVKSATRVMVTTTVPGAKVEVDGQASSDAPFIGEVKPGNHTVIVRAPGYEDERREVAVADGAVVALDLEPREKPALLSVTAPSGAEIVVDGRPSGVTPLLSPIPVGHGKHLVAVLKNGCLAWSREVTAARGETTSLDAQLEGSTQRAVAWTFLAGGLVGVATGAVFTTLTLDRQHRAQSFLDSRETGNVTDGQVADYDKARSERDRFRVWATGSLVAGGVLAGVSVVLFAFDRPSVTATASNLEKKPGAPPPKPSPSSPVEVSFVPSWSPGFVGGALIGAF